MNWIFTIGAPNARAALADRSSRNSRAKRQTDAAASAQSADPPRDHATQTGAEYERWLVEAMRHGDYDDY